MALTISNTLKKYAPLAAKVGGTVLPSLSVPLQAGAALLKKSSTSTPTSGLAPLTPQQAALPKANFGQSSTPTYTPPAAPVKGLLPPDSSSLSSALQGISGMSPQPQQQPPNFSGIVGGLVNASTPNPTQTGLVKNITDIAQGNRGIADEAKRISDMYGEQIARIGALGAGKVAGDLSTGTQVVGEGNAAIASQSASQRMNALAAAQEAALRGTGQQLTAQQQAANALDMALGGSNTQQSQQLSGLGSAAGFAQPQLGQIGSQQFYNPLTASAAGGGSLTPQNQAQTYAMEVLQGARTYDDAVAAMGLFGPVGKQVLDAAIRQGNPGFNFAQAQNLAGIQGTISPDVQFASEALIALQNSLQNLVIPGQTAGFKPVREASNFIAGFTGIGGSKEPTAVVAGLVADARTALQRALASAGGLTPSDAGSRAMQMLPDQPSAQDVAAAIKVIQELGAIRQNIYGSPGTSGNVVSPAAGGEGWY